MEILAPVGNLKNLKVSVYSGANAVYLGASKFNARAKTTEIDLDNLNSVTNFCHLHGVKVYLTLNTLIKQNEINELKNFILKAYNAGVDAFIIQDLAVYSLVKELELNIELHASTQMGINNLEGAKVLEKLGFSRVVLARETSLAEIERISKNTNLDIEYFVQGALCVSYSGNCYLSSLENKKSGNRGECLQLCRLKYFNGKDQKYFLSARDLCLINHIKALQKAGVTSLKIEGRLRRAAYVAQSILSYKNALQNKDVTVEIQNLKKVFSRGEFSLNGYLNDDKNLIEPNYNNHLGVKIGLVKSVKPFKSIYKIEIETKHILKTGDGLKFVSGINQQSLGVGNVDVIDGGFAIYSKTKPQPNSDVYLTVDSQFEANLESVTKPLMFNAKVKVVAGEKFECELKHKNNVINFVGDVVDVASNAPVTEQNIVEAFNKTKDSEFELSKIEAVCNNGFLPKSKLNEYRRTAINLLTEKVLSNYKFNRVQNNFEIKHLNEEGLKSNVYIFNSINQIKDFKNQTLVYAPSDYNNPEHFKFKHYLYLPIFSTQQDFKIIDNILNNNKNIVGVYINNLSGFKYANSHSIICSYNLNTINNLHKNILLNLGAKQICLSIEADLVNIAGNKFAGVPSVMNFIHCPKQACFDCSCNSNCKFGVLEYKSESGKTYKLRQTKLSACYFEMLSNSAFKSGNFIDLRS